MAEIVFQFPIKASARQVFQAISTPVGLDAWWTRRATGVPALDAVYELWFGSEYDWRAVVTRCEPDEEFEWEITVAAEDWPGTRVGFTLTQQAGVTTVLFRHAGWLAANAHFQVAAYCWAMYLRLLKRYIERGEVVAYDERDDA